jgi:hypothetical protein
VRKGILAIVTVLFLVAAAVEGADPIRAYRAERSKSPRARLAPLPEVGSDSCVGVPLIASLPYADSGNTCGFANDVQDYTSCTLDQYPGPDVVYQMNLGASNNVGFSLDLAGSAGDLALFVISTCGNGSTCLSFADTFIGAGLGPEVIAAQQYGGGSGGTFYVYVDSYYAVGEPAPCGTYTLNASGTLPAELIEFSVD